MKEDNKHVVYGPPAIEPLPNITLQKLLYNSLIQNLNKTEAIIDAKSGETITYREILTKTCVLAESLLRHKYGHKTIITISSENNLQFFIPVLASLYIGAIVAPINPNYKDKELIHCLNISKSRIIFCSKSASQKFINLKSRILRYIEKIIIIDSNEKTEGAETLENFIQKSLNNLRLDLFRLKTFKTNNKTAFILYSSGTTGLPKGVMITHRNVLVRYMHTLDPRYGFQSNNFLAFLPFYHGFGLITNLIALTLGQKIILLKNFEEEFFLKTIQNYQIQSLWCVPPVVILLAKSPLVENYNLSSLKDIVCGAATLSKEVEETVKNRLKIESVRQSYGFTEATIAVITVPKGVTTHGSCGQIHTYMSCKVRDPETGKSLGPNEIGELCFKGPLVMKGYYRNEKATKNSFTKDLWLLSGDLGYYDENKNFFIVGRLKELIKYNGFQVAPAELEAILLTNSKIFDVAVVGKKDDKAGELPTAFVVKKENVDLTESEVIDFLSERVSPQKHLRGGVIFTKEIPKNSTGKILRQELQQMLNIKAKL